MKPPHPMIAKFMTRPFVLVTSYARTGPSGRGRLRDGSSSSVKGEPFPHRAIDEHRTSRDSPASMEAVAMR
jgi:hypothetical protein